jgi:hypothetical protein
MESVLKKMLLDTTTADSSLFTFHREESRINGIQKAVFKELASKTGLDSL